MSKLNNNKMILNKTKVSIIDNFKDDGIECTNVWLYDNKEMMKHYHSGHPMDHAGELRDINKDLLIKALNDVSSLTLGTLLNTSVECKLVPVNDSKLEIYLDSIHVATVDNSNNSIEIYDEEELGYFWLQVASLMSVPKFEIGDKVDFVNDYGVVFKGKTITDIEVQDGAFRYQVEPNDTPWFLKYEKNLHKAGTYEEPNLDIKLNNGSVARFCHFSDGFAGEPHRIYAIKNGKETPYGKETLYCALLDGKLYSLSHLEEPMYPLDDQLQAMENQTSFEKKDA